MITYIKQHCFYYLPKTTLEGYISRKLKIIAYIYISKYSLDMKHTRLENIRLTSCLTRYSNEKPNSQLKYKNLL